MAKRSSGMNAIHESHKRLISRAEKYRFPEMALRQMAETIIDRLLEKGPSAKEELRRLTTLCLACERTVDFHPIDDLR